MVTSTCVFCGHGNPAGAKYCNECAAPLHLKPCPECDAVNDRAAIICYKCGAPYAIDAAVAESRGPSASSEAVVEERASEPGRPAPLQPTTEQSHEGDRPDRASLQALTNPVAFFERSLGETARRLPAQRGQAAPVEIRPSLVGSISPLRVGLLTVVVIGGAVLAYLAYRYPMGADALTNVTRAAVSDTTRSEAIRVTPLASEVDAGKPIMATAVGLPLSPNRETLSPMEPAAADSEEASTSRTVGPAAVAAAPSADPQSNAGSTPRASLESPVKPPSKARPRGPLHPSAARLEVSPSLSSGRDKAAAERGPTRACTEQVAALGLCTPRLDGGGT